MKKQGIRAFLSGVLLLASASAAFAEENFLWTVDGKHNRVYLLGSMHMLPPQAHPLPAVMDDAYRDSRVIVFETDIGAINKPDNQKVLLQAGTYPRGQTLSNSLPGEQLEKLVDVADELKLPVGMLDGYRPWLAALTLELSAYLKQGFKPDLGVDQRYYQRAQKDGKTIITLETLRAQTGFFTDLSDSMSMDYLDMTLYNLRDPEDLPLDVLEIWQDGDVGEMEDLLEDVQDDYPQLYQRFIRDRNRYWLPTILDLLKQKRNALVIVGALHMPGEDGLVNLLSKAGYEARQR